MPGPVLVKLNRVSIRDTIMTKKANLRFTEDRKNIFINPDEPVEVRRIKAIFRRVVANARNDGVQVETRRDCIFLDGVPYTHDEMHKIPNKFLPDGLKHRDMSDLDEQGAAAPPIQDDRDVQVPIVKPTDAGPKKKDLILPGEKMRIVEAGLCFSGDTAYPSNMCYAPIRFNNKEYISNEQAFQCGKAEHHDQLELAATLKEMTNSFCIKDEASNIVTTDEWDEMAPDFLWSLFDQKMKDNPELLERLIQTAPLLLIEASTSRNWGGGAPFNSKKYDTGEYPGDNKFGKMATRYRDQKIREREENSMT